MDNHRNDQAKLERLSEDIRKLGTPYVDPAPDDRYWAGLRVNVMERIAQQEQRGIASWVSKSREFLLEHLLGTSLAGAVAVMIAISVILNPFSPTNSPAPRIASQVAPGLTPHGTHANVPSSEVVKDLQKDLKQELAERAEGLHSGPVHLAPARDRDRWMAARHGERNRQTSHDLAQLEGQIDSPSELAAEPVLAHSGSDDPVILSELSTAELESVLESMGRAK